MNRFAKIGIVIAAVLLMTLIVADTVKPTLKFDFFAMNTFVSGEVKGKKLNETYKEIENTINTLDKMILSRTAEDSFIYNLNKNGEAIADTELFEYFTKLSEVCQKSGGAFDYTLGRVSDLWNFGGTPSIPDGAKLTEALSHSGYEKIILSDGNITLTDKNAVVDFGASGKGIALDEVRDYLDTADVTRAVISVGGSVLLYGDDDFTVGIKNPFGNSGYAAKLTIKECCVSTSGSYEQSFESGGKKYHHILNPETGYPAESGVVSATVISDSGLLSDALSTACFVLGIDKGFDLAEEFGAQVIFITEDGSIHLKENADINITPDSGDFTVVKH
ncbi:MAG: FAD:protein FMN transferase [Ruminococcaceae bacterium]|nr:FAD:protein FMN transferase [Oscillospiraceae bacterium]